MSVKARGWLATLQFIGGVGTVTGSKFLLDTQGQRILVDCGLFQGIKDLRLQNRSPFPVDPKSIHSVLLTHAHLDHSGYLPLLVKLGFRGKIFCTPPTKDLCKLILMDSAHIQEEDADYANHAGYSKHAPALPLYTAADVERVYPLFSTVEKDSWFRINEEVKVRFKTSGHILGSVFVEVQLKKQRVVFSGDLGRPKPLLLAPPSPIDRTDYLVVESTYGDRLHLTQSPLKVLQRIVTETCERRGHLIIPSFAVGRTQELLFLMSKLKAQRLIPDVPIFLDSPMGVNATEIFLDHPSWHKLGPKEVKSLASVVTMVRHQQQSKELMRRKGSTVVIAGSGMVSGGRVLHHLEDKLPHEKNTVLLVGFQAAGTRGRLLKDGITELKIHGSYVPVRAKIEEISSLSAHADQGETLKWLKNFKFPPKRTFIVHGEPQASDALRVKIKDTFEWEACIPKPMEVVGLK